MKSARGDVGLALAMGSKLKVLKWKVVNGRRLSKGTDGIRSIREGTLILFEKLLEASLEQGPVNFVLVERGDFVRVVKRALKQSFTTIDLARKGEKAEIAAILQPVKIRTDSFCKLDFDLDPAA